MSLDRFLEEPWKTSHSAYEDSPFNIRPAPEFATAEVVVASLYRGLGFAGYSETLVPAAGREFDKAGQGKAAQKGAGRVSADTWRTVLHGVLESPKQPNQSSKRFLQLSPVVPDVALYSGSARLTGNSWNPGALVRRMVELGSDSVQDAEALWERLFQAMSVGDDDDLWARWLQEEFEKRKRSGPSWKKGESDTRDGLPPSEKAALRFPARQFVRDVAAIVDAKPAMTRRQWVSLLEAVLRLGTVTHVLWLCDVNDRIWREIRRLLDGGAVGDANEIRDRLVSSTHPFLAYGNPAVPTIRDYASRYLVARLGINLCLWQLETLSVPVRSLSSCTDLRTLLVRIDESRAKLVSGDFFGQFSGVQDEQARTVACKKGIGSNLVEFGRHVLGQRQTANESLRGYDQGYILRKKGEHASAPWIVSLGPVAVLAFVHCCLKETAGPRSVQRLCQHLGWYGLEVDRDDIADGDLGKKLRMLGLVLDSPDAESGMLLVPPFQPGRNEGDQ
ncbi:MAG: hypothetical protein AMXMBFR58_16020 [Phycisphaerae bacterium]